jgi:hypothetical protein
VLGGKFVEAPHAKPAPNTDSGKAASEMEPTSNPPKVETSPVNRGRPGRWRASASSLARMMLTKAAGGAATAGGGMALTALIVWIHAH